MHVLYLKESTKVWFANVTRVNVQTNIFLWGTSLHICKMGSEKLCKTCVQILGKREKRPLLSLYINSLATTAILSCLANPTVSTDVGATILWIAHSQSRLFCRLPSYQTQNTCKYLFSLDRCSQHVGGPFTLWNTTRCALEGALDPKQA